MLSRTEQHLHTENLNPTLAQKLFLHIYILSIRYPGCLKQNEFHLLGETKDSETTCSVTISWSSILQNLILISSLVKTFKIWLPALAGRGSKKQTEGHSYFSLSS